MRKYLMTGAATAALIFGLSQAMAQQKPETGGNAPAAATGAPSGGASADQKKMGQSQDQKGDQKKMGQSQDQKGGQKTIGQSQDTKSDQKMGQKPDMKSDQKMGQGTDQKTGQGKEGQKSTVGQSKDTSKDTSKEPSKMGSQPSTQGQGTQGQKSTQGQSTQGGTSTSQQGQTGTSSSQSTQSGTSSQTTTGAASSGTVQLNEQQRTEVRQTVLNSGPRVDNINFSVSVGTVIPRSTRVVVVPETLVRIHPEWRRHKYFIYNDQIIIVDDNFRIIAVVQV